MAKQIKYLPLCDTNDEIGIENDGDFIAGEAHFKKHVIEIIKKYL